jgi:hypothetical protein
MSAVDCVFFWCAETAFPFRGRPNLNECQTFSSLQKYKVGAPI